LVKARCSDVSEALVDDRKDIVIILIMQTFIRYRMSAESVAQPCSKTLFNYFKGGTD